MTLVSYVHVYDDGGNAHAFGPGDKIPAWARERIGAHCFADDSPSDDVQPEATVTPPPKAGRGASAAAWREYAEAVGMAVDPDAGREAVIETLAEHGVPVD